MNKIEEDVYVDVYVPIKDLEKAKIELNEEFEEQGYDIYDKKNIFYTDFCTPASLGNNDITLDDRKKDIYPYNASLCKNNCIYIGKNIEEKKIICSCNLNSNKNVDYSFIEEDDENFATYLLDNINYKIFRCFKLFFDFGNLKNTTLFISYYQYLPLLKFSMVYIFFIHLKN